MNLDLSSVRAKIDRAAEHLHALNMAFGVGVERDARLRADFDPVQQRHKLVYVGDTVPKNAATIFGDYVHNTRSALDHLVGAVLHANRVKVRSYHSYPFCVSENRFRTYVSNRDPTLEGWSCLEGFTDDQMEVVAMHQPYIGRDETEARRSPLYLLHLAWNVDKHRRIHARRTSLVKFPIIDAGPAPWVKVLNVTPLLGANASLEPETVFALLTIGLHRDAPSDIQPEVNANLPVTVSFHGQGGLKIPYSIVRLMLWEAVAAIQGFDQTFEPPEVLTEGTIVLTGGGAPPAHDAAPGGEVSGR